MIDSSIFDNKNDNENDNKVLIPKVIKGKMIYIQIEKGNNKKHIYFVLNAISQFILVILLFIIIKKYII